MRGSGRLKIRRRKGWRTLLGTIASELAWLETTEQESLERIAGRTED